jgi:hypothetical protein
MHSGGHYGFITGVCFDPAKKVGAIALVNGMGNAPELAMQLGPSRAKPCERRLRPSRFRPQHRRSGERCRVCTSVTTSARSFVSSGVTERLTFVDPADPT